MATRKQKDDEMQEGLELLTDDSFNAESLNPALESLYAELGMGDGADATVHITKLNADERGVEAQIWKGDPSDYDLERIARRFGSGEYRVKIYVRVPTGQKVLKGNKVFAWLLSPEDEAKRVAPQNIANPANLQIEIARAVAEAIKAALPAMVQPFTTPVASQQSPLELMKGMAEVMALMNSAQNNVQQANPLSMIKDVLEITNGLRSEAEPLERGTNANSNDLMLALINKFGPLLASAIPAQIPQVAPETQAMPNQAMISSQPVTQPNVVQQTEDDVSFKIKMGLKFLMSQCDAGGAPQTYAEVVLDSIPPDSLAVLLNNPAPLEWMSQFDARVKNSPYADWFTAVINECKSMMSETDNDGDGSEQIA